MKQILAGFEKKAGLLGSALGFVAKRPLATAGAVLTASEIGGAAKQGFKTVPTKLNSPLLRSGLSVGPRTY